MIVIVEVGWLLVFWNIDFFILIFVNPVVFRSYKMLVKFRNPIVCVGLVVCFIDVV